MNTHETMTEVEQAAYNAVMQAGSCNKRWHNVLAEAERGAIKAALEFMRGNQTNAAVILDVSRNTLRDRIGRYGLHRHGIPAQPRPC